MPAASLRLLQKNYVRSQQRSGAAEAAALTAQPGNPFFRGSPSYRLVASELADADPGRFSGLTPKAVRDKTILLLEHHKAGDEWKKKQ